jgi:hypothetical protein
LGIWLKRDEPISIEQMFTLMDVFEKDYGKCTQKGGSSLGGVVSGIIFDTIVLWSTLQGGGTIGGLGSNTIIHGKQTGASGEKKKHGVIALHG